MTGIRKYRRFLDSQMFWLSFFLFLGTLSGTIFCNYMSEEMKQMLEAHLSGILVPSELAAADKYRLCVGVLKKRFVWFLMGLLIYRSSRPGVLFGISAVYVSFQMSMAVCLLTMHAGMFGIIHFFGLIFPQGIFDIMASYLLWIGIGKEDRWENTARIAACACLLVLGAGSEIFLNPVCSSFLFRAF